MGVVDPVTEERFRPFALVVLLAVAACSADEGDTPDVSVPSHTLATTVECDGSAPDASDVAACLAAATTAIEVADSTEVPTVVTATPTVPVTCGPDPDETHPPPCD
jgi:hypothetical protein